MTVEKYNNMPYHLWNPFTEMDEMLKYMGFGPIVIARGSGPYVFNEKGKKYINGFSSLWNVAIGHGREELADVAAQQIRDLAYASCFRQVHPRAIELAAKLVEITGGHYQHAYLGTNGSEAIETALKMARQYHRQSKDPADHGKYKVISLENSYHGVSYGAISTSGLKSDSDKFGPLIPGYIQIPPPYCYRCPFNKGAYPECGLACAKALEEKILEEGPETVAAFIMEPVMGAYGVVAPPEEYYAMVGRICKKYGILFIADEVTTGFGRTGKLFATEDWDPRPDILCLGKAISSGYLPLAATLATAEIYERFKGKGREFDHGSTASGHPVCAAVGLKNIEIILQEDVVENARIMGEKLMTELNSVKEKNDRIGDIRGRGLMIGIELVKSKKNKEPLDENTLWNTILDFASLGLLVYYKRNIIGLLPPLIIDEGIVKDIGMITEKALAGGTVAAISRKARLLKEYAGFKLNL